MWMVKTILMRSQTEPRNMLLETDLCRLIVQRVRVGQARMLLPSVSREPTKSCSGGCTSQSHGGRATQSHGAGTPAWESCRCGTSTLVSSEGRALSQRGLFLSP